MDLQSYDENNKTDRLCIQILEKFRSRGMGKIRRTGRKLLAKGCQWNPDQSDALLATVTIKRHPKIANFAVKGCKWDFH
jgi:hypothetical protein